MVGNQWGNVAKSLGGAAMNYMADRDMQNAQVSQNAAQQEFNTAYNDAPDDAARQALLIGAQGKGLRTDLQQAFRKEEADRIERGEQLAADRVARAEEAEARRVWQAEQDAKYKRTMEDALKLKQTPTIHITNSGSGGGQSSPFAGSATQIGVDARDPTKAVYRIGKTGQVFSFDENGQPQSHEGAIAPKPAAPKESTESERLSAGYLGRMEEAEKNLTTAKSLPYLQQRGLERAPGLTNYTLTPAQQVVRQQQEDWVRAKLRKESGAVIGDEEMAREIRTYFPQAGDSKEVIASKAQSRAQAHEQMRSSSGKVKPTVAPPVSPAGKTIDFGSWK